MHSPQTLGCELAKASGCELLFILQGSSINDQVLFCALQQSDIHLRAGIFVMSYQLHLSQEQSQRDPRAAWTFQLLPDEEMKEFLLLMKKWSLPQLFSIHLPQGYCQLTQGLGNPRHSDGGFQGTAWLMRSNLWGIQQVNNGTSVPQKCRLSTTHKPRYRHF